jgi:hypothetical protein
VSARLPFQPDEGVRLEQVDRKRFLLLRGFTYNDPEGEAHVVTAKGVGRTDLTSVPSILWWFVASYGRQTRAALVHDQLVVEIERHDADWVFRKALGDSGIGWARRWLVFTAVSFETTFRTIGQGVDREKTAALALRRKADGAPSPGPARRRRRGRGVRRHRRGRLVTVLGFAAVGLHLGVVVWLIARAASTAAWIAAALVAAGWVVAWGAWRSLGVAGLGRLLSFVGGVLVIVPFTALLLVPLGLVYACERGVWAARVVFWLVVGRRRGAPPPPAPDFGSTRTAEPKPLQRL